MGQYITISVETLSSYLSITNEGDEHHTGSYDTSLTRPNDYVGNDMDIRDHPSCAIISFIDISTAHSCNWKLDDEENWVRLSNSPHSAVPTHNTFTEAINGMSLQVDACFIALTAHFDDCYTQLDGHINELASRFPLPSGY
ncbi:hypothetical protein Goshw_007390 [Gossypium schwendimanii]|uniref:Uncharacterized protein n=1 Tax=Gossypium schwendimanii TaxID=34291 RepID=A0A7J9L1J7_GOSSC|nr:hypothetical protein [Gossypium schwendimanii]